MVISLSSKVCLLVLLCVWGGGRGEEGGGEDCWAGSQMFPQKQLMGDVGLSLGTTPSSSLDECVDFCCKNADCNGATFEDHSEEPGAKNVCSIFHCPSIEECVELDLGESFGLTADTLLFSRNEVGNGVSVLSTLASEPPIRSTRDVRERTASTSSGNIDNNYNNTQPEGEQGGNGTSENIHQVTSTPHQEEVRDVVASNPTSDPPLPSGPVSAQPQSSEPANNSATSIHPDSQVTTPILLQDEDGDGGIGSGIFNSNAHTLPAGQVSADLVNAGTTSPRIDPDTGSRNTQQQATAKIEGASIISTNQPPVASVTPGSRVVTQIGTGGMQVRTSPEGAGPVGTATVPTSVEPTEMSFGQRLTSDTGRLVALTICGTMLFGGVLFICIHNSRSRRRNQYRALE